MYVIDVLFMTQEGHSHHVGVRRRDFEQRKIGIAHGSRSEIRVGQVDPLLRAQPRTLRFSRKYSHLEFVEGCALDDARQLPVVKDDALADSCSLESSWECAPDPRTSGFAVTPGYGRFESASQHKGIADT
jgi:hypothetical protein